MKNVMQLCNCSSAYRGNFIDSLCSIPKYTNYNNIYVFCEQASSSECQFWINELRQEGSIIYILTGSYLRDFFLLKKICKKHEICLIHTHFYHFKMFLLLRILNFIEPINIIHHFHNFDSYSRIKRILNNLFLINTVYIGCSSTVANNLKEIFPKNIVYEVANGISLHRLSMGGFTRKRHTHKLLMFGNKFYNKGVDIAIDAIKNLQEEYPDIELFIVFSIEMEKNKQIICKHLQSNDLPSWICLLPPTQNIERYYKQVSYFLSLSRSEGFCTSIPEAAYCGCQVIASDIPAQYHNHKKIPFINFFRSQDVQSFSQTLQKALKHSLSKKQQENICSYIARRYDVRLWAQKIATIYDVCLFRK